MRGKTYDIEVWLPGAACLSRDLVLLGLRRLPGPAHEYALTVLPESKGTEFVHTLQRFRVSPSAAPLIAVIENYQNQDGTITIPQVLRPYMGGAENHRGRVMGILLTNDDGIHAEGLEVLERIARTVPTMSGWWHPRPTSSGFAHSLSLSEPLRMRKLGRPPLRAQGARRPIASSLGVRRLLPEPPDLILSGVNSGSNIADDVTYSGTIAGAMEGTLLGVRSIALSQAYTMTEEGRVLRWDTAEQVGLRDHRQADGARPAAGRLPEHQFPRCRARRSEGTRVASQGKRLHGLWIDERKDGRGFPYYWLRFGREAQEVREGSDMAALRDGFVSVTPLHLDLTAHEVMDPIAKALS